MQLHLFIFRACAAAATMVGMVILFAYIANQDPNTLPSSYLDQNQSSTYYLTNIDTYEQNKTNGSK